MNSMLYFLMSGAKSRRSCQCVGSKPYVAGERNEKRPLSKAVKFDAGTLSDAFFDKVVFVEAMDALNDWTT